MSRSYAFHRTQIDLARETLRSAEGTFLKDRGWSRQMFFGEGRWTKEIGGRTFVVGSMDEACAIQHYLEVTSIGKPRTV